MEKGKKAPAIIAYGPGMIKQTKKYTESVEYIKAEISLKYTDLLKNEGNFVRRFLLKVRMQLEIRRAIRALTSAKKLYFGTQRMA